MQQQKFVLVLTTWKLLRKDPEGYKNLQMVQFNMH